MLKAKKIAVVQSDYIPRREYFDPIVAVDEYILYDNMQHTRKDWRNRNQIKTLLGAHWISVSAKVMGRYRETIRDTAIEGVDWAQNHWKSIAQDYRRAPYSKEVAEFYEPIYIGRRYALLSELN
jgi:hypothetical protein